MNKCRRLTVQNQENVYLFDRKRDKKRIIRLDILYIHVIHYIQWITCLQTLNFHFHTFPFIFKHSLTSERMDIYIFVHLANFHNLLIHFHFFRWKFARWTKSIYNAVWISIRSLVCSEWIFENERKCMKMKV